MSSSPLVSEIYDIFDEIEDVVGARVLSRKWEILNELFLNPDIRPQHFRSSKSMSSAAFFNLLADLEAGELILSRVDPTDRRSRIYCLTPPARDDLLSASRELPNWLKLQPICADGLEAFMPNLALRARKLFGIPYFSTEYRLIIFLYDCGPLKTSDLLRMSGLSGSTFFKVLKKLTDRGIVAARPAPADGRVLHYALRDDIRHFIGARLKRARQCLARRSVGHYAPDQMASA